MRSGDIPDSRVPTSPLSRRLAFHGTHCLTWVPPRLDFSQGICATDRRVGRRGQAPTAGEQGHDAISPSLIG